MKRISKPLKVETNNSFEIRNLSFRSPYPLPLPPLPTPGTFGRVVECWDREVEQYCAVKVIRNVPKYREAAMMEVEVLQQLHTHDKGGARGCVHLKGWFDHRGHVCMVHMSLPWPCR